MNKWGLSNGKLNADVRAAIIPWTVTNPGNF